MRKVRSATSWSLRTSSNVKLSRITIWLKHMWPEMPHLVPCRLRGRLTKYRQIQSQGSTIARLRDVTPLAVKTQTQLINEKTAKMGVTGWNKRKVTPETYAFQVVRSGFHYLSFGA